jgi:hypothetical protein
MAVPENQFTMLSQTNGRTAGEGNLSFHSE